ncbi:GGDEF domain-containing protein [Nitrosospira multiformis]|uniref:GGDEF domain-containing protein n=1 Tax=Nitrosospira multiformis TaxID=1231 RepID=UPI000D313E1C|nr:GGDEF domain-containing protein [Nitrosospira multiformis]
MNTEATPHCATLGFDKDRIQQTLSLLGLDAAHEKVAASSLLPEVIPERVDEIINSCFAVMMDSDSFELIEKDIGTEAFRQEWKYRLQSFGKNFATPGYFEERLALAAAFAHANIPLGALQLPSFLIQQALIDSLSDKADLNADKNRALLNIILNLTALDLYLSAEGYRLPELYELEEKLDTLRAEASRLQQKAWTDELTGTMSYRKLMESLEHHIKRAVRRGHERSPLCLIMSDLDFFKKINDTYGHMVGDLVLRHLAGRIKSATRDFDMIGRFGGEEFVVIMADTDLELAKVIAERIRLGVMRTPFHIKKFNIHITISLGVAMLKPGESRESLLERADAAMYEAKRRGRNCVVTTKEM